MSFSIYDEKQAYEAARIRWTWLDTVQFRNADAFRAWAYDAFRVDALSDFTAWKNCYWARVLDEDGKPSTSWGSMSIDSIDRRLVADDVIASLAAKRGPLGEGRASGAAATTLVFEGGSEDLQMKELWKMVRKTMFPGVVSKPQVFAVVVHVDGQQGDLCVPHAHIVHAPRFGIFSMARTFTKERDHANDVLGTFKRGSDVDRRRLEAAAEEILAEEAASEEAAK